MMTVISVTSCGGGNAGGGGEDVPSPLPTDRVVQRLPDKLIYVCDSTVFVKDGNEKYVKQPSEYSSNRLEVYIKENLTVPVVFDTNDNAQNWISARLNSSDEWVCADEDDDGGTPNVPHWHSNDKNCQVYHEAESTTRTGYRRINIPYDQEYVTITQLENETITIGDNAVECVVWKYTYDNTSVDVPMAEEYTYWYAKDTGVFLQEYIKTVFDDPQLVTKATRYEVGVNMDAALASLETPRTKYTFDSKYH